MISGIYVFMYLEFIYSRAVDSLIQFVCRIGGLFESYRSFGMRVGAYDAVRSVRASLSC